MRTASVSLNNDSNVEDSATVKVTFGIYIVNLLGIMLPMLPLAGIIFAYIFRRDAHAYLTSHFLYLIRSFWMLLLYVTISCLLTPILVGLILLPCCYIWWIIRMGIGIKSLMRQQAVSDPNTWLF